MAIGARTEFSMRVSNWRVELAVHNVSEEQNYDDGGGNETSTQGISIQTSDSAPSSRNPTSILLDPARLSYFRICRVHVVA